MKKMEYYNSELVYTNETYIDYLDWCEMNEFEPKDEGSQDYYDYQMMVAEDYWQDFNTNLKYSDYKDCEVKIEGSLGLWDGRHQIKSVKLPLVEAIKKCIGNADGCNVFVKRNGSKTLHIESYHHDGTNLFTLKFTDKSINPDYLY